MNSQTPWNANFSSALNRIVDEILIEDDLDVDDKSRPDVMRSLCRHRFEMKRWRKGSDFLFCLFPESPSHFLSRAETLEFNTMLANILLGRRTTLNDPHTSHEILTRTSPIFGTPLEVCIKSGQVKLAASLLETTGIDLNNESFQILEIAIECENLEMLRLLFTPKYNLACGLEDSSRMNNAIAQAIQNGRSDAAHFLIHACSSPPTYQEYIPHWIENGARYNNFAFVRTLVDELENTGAGLTTSTLAEDKCIARIVAFYGHVDMLRFLSNYDTTWNHSRMMLAAVSGGHIPMVRYLLHDRAIWADLSAERWRDLLLVAVEHGTPYHFKLVEALFTDPTILRNHQASTNILFQKPSIYAELFRHACGYGNVFLITKIAEAGANLDQLVGYEDVPPILVALLAGQAAVANALIELGAKPIDPMQTVFREGFEKGDYPRAWTRRAFHWHNCMEGEIRPHWHFSRTAQVLRYK